jgi:YHS domain-containing protein
MYKVFRCTMPAMILALALCATTAVAGPEAKSGAGCTMHATGAAKGASWVMQAASTPQSIATQIPPAVLTAAKQAGPMDPVSGKKVKSAEAPIAIFLDAVYRFESAANLAKFRAAPEKYATTRCPVSDQAVRIKDAAEKSEYGGRTWYFCSAGCKGKFDDTPADYVTYRCPSCGGIAPVSMGNPVRANYDGREMRFCCDHCKAAFDVDPAAYFKLVVPEGGIADSTEGAVGREERAR